MAWTVTASCLAGAPPLRRFPLPDRLRRLPEPSIRLTDSIVRYFNEEAVEKLAGMGLDPHIATGRQKHNEQLIPLVAGALPAEASVQEKMAHKLRSAAGLRLYAAR